MSIIDLSAGHDGAYGWLGVEPADGVIRCYGEADSCPGQLTLLTSVSPGDVVTGAMPYAQTGRIKCKATDLGTGATAAEYFNGPDTRSVIIPHNIRHCDRSLLVYSRKT